MKRLISLVLACMLFFSMTACSREVSPETVVQEFASSLQAGDIEKAKSYLETNLDLESAISETDTGMSEGFDAEMEACMDEFLREQLMTLTYEISESSEQEDSILFLVTFDHADITSVFSDLIGNLFGDMFSMALSGASEEDMTARVAEILEETLADAEVGRAQTVVDMYCVETDDGIKIRLDDEGKADLMNVLSGNLLMISDLLDQYSLYV